MSLRLSFISALLILAFAMPLLVSAQLDSSLTPAQIQQQNAGFVPLSDANFANLVGTPPSPGDTGSLGKVFSGAFRVALSIGAILAVLRIAYAGYLYMGTDMWSNKRKAKEILGDVVLGVLLLLSIWLILKQINPDILNLDILRNAQQAPTPTPPAAQASSPTGGI